MSEKKENYCRWCDTLVNRVIKELDKGRLVWVGCSDCYVKKKELENNGKTSR